MERQKPSCPFSEKKSEGAITPYTLSVPTSLIIQVDCKRGEHFPLNIMVILFKQTFFPSTYFSIWFLDKVLWS